MSEVHSSLQKVFEKEGKTKIENVTILHLRPIIPGRKCLKKKVNTRLKHNPIHKVHSSLQKVLEKEGKAKIENLTIPHLRFHSSFQNQHDTCADCYYIMVGGS